MGDGTVSRQDFALAGRHAGDCRCRPLSQRAWYFILAGPPAPEITGIVLCRLPSHEDRLSLAAVCHDWRLAAQHQRLLLPPAMPCINLGNGVYHNLADDDGKVRRFATPRGYVASASFGSWLLYDAERRGSRRCFLRAPNFPAMEVPCLYIQRGPIPGASSTTYTLEMGPDVKMVVCSSRLVVAIFRRHIFGPTMYSSGVSKHSNIACFRPTQQLPAIWSPGSSYDNHCTSDLYTDIAFYRGKIFALTSSEKLFCYDFFANDSENQQKKGDRVINHATEEEPAWSNNHYLVVTSDKQKLLMVRWNRSSIIDDHLRVFEADFDEGKWSELKDLSGQVLFLSRNCSKAFKAGSLEHCDIRFRGRNCLTVLGNELAESWIRLPAVYGNHAPSYFVYDMVSGETSLVLLDRAHNIERSRSGWFFPNE